MSRVTIFLDECTEARLDRAVKEAGVSRSRRVADLMREKAASEWPASVRRLAGSWKEFPEVNEIRKGLRGYNL